jgi:hypothetical protein
MEWYQEPPKWSVKDKKVNVCAAAKTDFWRKTHYGFIRDNGHFYFQKTEGDFTAAVKISGQYKSLYDQAGLMVRVDESNWVKCGVEFVDGVQQASAVVTRDFSDWSVVALPQNPASIWLKATRCKETIEVYYSLNGLNFAMLRLAYFGLGSVMDVGLMCASPDGNGFSVTFEDFKIVGEE